MPEYIKDSGCEGEGDRREEELAVTAYSVGAVEGLLFLRFQLCTPSVIGAEDICKRSFSCTDATSLRGREVYLNLKSPCPLCSC